MQKKWIIVASCVIVILIVAGIVAYYYWPRPQAKTEILIGAAVSQTGALAPMGNKVIAGYRLWEEYINSEGGLLGMTVRIIMYDDQSDPTRTKSLYERLITVDQVDFVLGPYSSGCSLAMAPVAEKYKKITIHPLSTAGELYNNPDYDYQFLAKVGGISGIGVPSMEEDYLHVQFFKSFADIRTVGVINTADYYPRSRANSFKALAQYFGLRVTFEDEIPKEATDVTAVITRIKEANPDIFVVIGFLPIETLLIRTAFEQGYHPKMIFGATCNIPEAWNILGDKCQGVVTSLDFLPSLNFTESKKFVQLYQNKYGKLPEGHFEALGFASCQLLEAAIKATKSLNQDRIKEWLINNEVETCVGPWKLSKVAFDLGYKYVPEYFKMIPQWQNGKMEIVYPTEIATATPIYPIP
ncbi:MAG: amino acid ABC transporter substrate-binding protein [Candidatus Bathyarchaeia archaeon]